LFDSNQQIVLEMVLVKDKSGSNLVRGDQMGLSARYQIPITNAIILRADVMAGFRSSDDDFGARFEIRRKF